jgi:hypothetical protein
MKNFAITLLVISVFLCQRAIADEIISCTSCTTEAQFKYKASSKHISKYGNSNSRSIETYQVINPKTGNIQAVTVHYFFERELNSSRIISRIAAVDPVLKADVDELLFLVANANEDITIPLNITDSVFNVFSDTRVTNRISRHLALTQKWQTIAARAGAYVTLPLTLMNKIISFNAVVSVFFNDGSSMELKFVGLDSRGLTIWEYLEGSAKDSNGNHIPEKKSQAIKKYFFLSSNQLNSFKAHLTRLGVRIRNNNIPPSRMGRVTIIDCPGGVCEIKEEGGDSGDD